MPCPDSQQFGALPYHMWLDAHESDGQFEQGTSEGASSLVFEKACSRLSFDHDIIDGAPAARFVSRLGELVESGYGLHTGEREQLAVAR